MFVLRLTFPIHAYQCGLLSATVRAENEIGGNGFASTGNLDDLAGWIEAAQIQM
jgi:hypothetical protein